MKYLNLPSGASQDPLMIPATDAEVGIWFRLQCYCTQQMNGGSIQACKEWTDDMWMRAAGIRAASVAQDSSLWHYNAMGWLILHLYNTVAEEAYRKKQHLGRIYAEKRWTAQNQQKIIQIESGNSNKPQKKIKS